MQPDHDVGRVVHEVHRKSLDRVSVIVYRRQSRYAVLALADLVRHIPEFGAPAPVRAGRGDAVHTKIPDTEGCIFLRHRVERVCPVIPQLVGVSRKAPVIGPVHIRQVLMSGPRSVIKMLQISVTVDLHMIRGPCSLEYKLSAFLHIANAHRFFSLFLCCLCVQKSDPAISLIL